MAKVEPPVVKQAFINQDLLMEAHYAAVIEALDAESRQCALEAQFDEVWP